MKVILDKLWNEPAAFIGLLTTVILAIGAIVTGSDWDLTTIIAILAPLVSALGIRQAVTPTKPTR